MIKTLLDFFSRPATETKNQTPEGICPNCWGEQEYDNKFRTLYEDKQIDVNNHEAHYAFIQDYIVTHVTGIHLKKGNNSLECPTCQAKLNS
jgi:hypothetical protein